MASPVLHAGSSGGALSDAEADTARALEQVLENCTDHPLDKPHYYLLQRACILSSLSQRVYDPAQTAAQAHRSDLQLTRLPCASKAPAPSLSEDPAAIPEATLLSGPQPGLPVHAIWNVRHVGVVVAFRGTADLHDAYTDICFAPASLPGSNIRLHGAVYSAAAQCVPHIQAVYTQAAQQSMGEETPALFLTGHSLGGGYANCCFLHILTSDEVLSKAVLQGGSYTFGAPLVACRHDISSDVPQAIQLLFLQHHSSARGWTQLPVYNFVNGLDIVPRLLGDTTVHLVAKALACLLPKSLTDLLHRTSSVSSSFAPFGTYCLMLNNMVRIIDSAADSQLLQLTVGQLFSGAQQIGQSKESAPFVLQRFLGDHAIAGYKSMLRDAISSMVPLLFMGGHVSDYQPLLVERQTAHGIVQEVALKHKGTGVIGHNAFMEFPVVKALKGAGIVAAGVAAGVSVAAKGDSFESTKVLRAAMHGAVKYAVTGHAIDVPKLIQAPVQEMPVGALASKYVTSSNSPSKGFAAATSVLGVANLAVGFLNLGLTGYNTYKLRGISKLQKVMDCKLDSIGNQLTGLTQGQQMMTEKLEWIARSQEESKAMSGAIVEGMGNLQLMLQDQAVMLNGIVKYCQALQQGQDILIDGQSILIEGQKVLLQEVLSLRKDMVQGAESVLKELQTLSVDAINEKLDELTSAYTRLLRVQGTERDSLHMREQVATFANKLQAAAKTWLGKVPPGSADKVAVRQPFVAAYAIAAVAWDAADATNTAHDTFQYRKQAVKLIDGEILMLLQKSTNYSFATTFQDTMMRYVFLRRALQARASIDEVLSDKVTGSSDCAITYEARDLMWDDGFDQLRDILSPAQATDKREQIVPDDLICCSNGDMQWYCSWKGMPSHLQSLSCAPVVYKQELLLDLGVPQQQLQLVSQHLSSDSFAALRQMVLPSFVQDAVSLMDSQLPEMHLMQKQQSLFAG
ncbi:TPA: hypothetical protein ACH3X2_012940 [Trebouxia sp. C0005]